MQILISEKKNKLLKSRRLDLVYRLKMDQLEEGRENNEVEDIFESIIEVDVIEMSDDEFSR